MKKLKLFVLLLFFAVSAFGNKVIPLPELTRPQFLFIKGDYLLTTQFPEVLIYSMKDFKLHTKFGRRGEGPQEFLRWIRGQFHPTDKNIIVVSSQAKVSTFTLEGRFINEMKMDKVRYRTELRPIGKNHVLRGSTMDRSGNSAVYYRTLELYNSKLEKIKDLFKWISPVQSDGIDPTTPDFFGGEYTIYDNKIFLLIRNKGNIEVFSAGGEKLYSINYNGYEQIPVTGKDKDAFWEYFKTDPRHREHIDQIRREVKFPEYFSAARHFFVTDDKIYVLTNKKNDGKSQVVIFDLRGKLLKKIMLPVEQQNPQEPCPTTIHKGKLYQLIEDLDAEEWNLVITDTGE